MVTRMSARAISLVRHVDGACVVVLTGEHDLSSAPELTDALADAARSAPATVVDMSETSFIDSAVLGVLIASHRDTTAAGHGWGLVVGAGSGAAVRRILELTGLATVMPIYPGREQALAALVGSETGMAG
jgi:anti-sigma B factor antagonist